MSIHILRLYLRNWTTSTAYVVGILFIALFFITDFEVKFYVVRWRKST